MTGTIATLHSDGYGYIAEDDSKRPWKLIFRQADVAGGGFAGLKVGQRVRFEPEPLPGNPSRRHAVLVAPLD